MRVKGTIVEKQYYVIEVEVPDGARPSEQAEAIWDAFYERNSTGVIEPDDMDLDGAIYDMVIVEGESK